MTSWLEVTEFGFEYAGEGDLEEIENVADGWDVGLNEDAVVLYDAGDEGALDAEKFITFESDMLEPEFSNRICSSVSEIGVDGSVGEFVLGIVGADRLGIPVDPPAKQTGTSWIVELVVAISLGFSL